ncbi:hypothetical protein VPH35_053149 [Triticum aestivum]
MVQRLHQHHLLVAADGGADGGRVPGQHAGGEGRGQGPRDAVVGALPLLQGGQQERGVLQPAIQPQPLLPSLVNARGIKGRKGMVSFLADAIMCAAVRIRVLLSSGNSRCVLPLAGHCFIRSFSCYYLYACRSGWGGAGSVNQPFLFLTIPQTRSCMWPTVV